MSVWDLIKATAVCASTGALVYSYPVVSQVLLIAFLSLLWLLYVRQACQHFRK